LFFDPPDIAFAKGCASFGNKIENNCGSGRDGGREKAAGHFPPTINLMLAGRLSLIPMRRVSGLTFFGRVPDGRFAPKHALRHRFVRLPEVAPVRLKTSVAGGKLSFLDGF